MKRITLVSLVTLSLIYATAETKTDVAMEYEHQLKSASSDESVSEDMSKMKAMGKCGAEQMGKYTHPTKSMPSKANIEFEHAIKTASSDESVSEDMSKMKAMGKCGADQMGDKPVIKKDKNISKSELEYEHNLKLPTSEEDIGKDMGNMKAMGKCGSD